MLALIPPTKKKCKFAAVVSNNVLLQIKTEDYIFVVTNSFTKCMTHLDLQTTENNQEMDFVLLHLIRDMRQLERIGVVVGEKIPISYPRSQGVTF